MRIKRITYYEANAAKVVFAFIQLGILAKYVYADEIRYSRTGRLSPKVPQFLSLFIGQLVCYWSQRLAKLPTLVTCFTLCNMLYGSER